MAHAHEEQTPSFASSRMSVVGCSGSGKSSVAAVLAAGLGVEHIQLDALHWEPGWQEADKCVFRARVEGAVAGERWVIDGNYHGKIGTLVWERADTVVWVRVPKWRMLRQVVTRTIRRAATREQLWNGNREGWGGLALWRREDSVVWWAWHSYAAVEQRLKRAMQDPRFSHIRFVTVHSRAEAAALAAELRDARDAAAQFRESAHHTVVGSVNTVEFDLKRGDTVVAATASWNCAYEGPNPTYTVLVTAEGLGGVTGVGPDAFEALCRVRETCEPDGWRFGVAGSREDVWPSGMSRDQGGGLAVYVMADSGAGGTVETFSPIDPARAVTLAEQRQHIASMFPDLVPPSTTGDAPQM